MSLFEFQDTNRVEANFLCLVVQHRTVRHLYCAKQYIETTACFAKSISRRKLYIIVYELTGPI